MIKYTQNEIAEKIKKTMESFVKANKDSWKKNQPPYLKNALAAVVIDLMADAWDAGYAAYNGQAVPPANPYVTEEKS